MKLDQLTDTLGRAGVGHHVVRQGRGGYVICPQGARVLGAWPGPDDDNVFWLAACCSTAESLKAAVDSGDWNLGGDRLWFSPELNLFVKSAEATGPEFVPLAIDPGSYDLRADGDVVVMRQSGVVRDGREAVDVHFEAERVVRPADPPVSDLAGLDYVGYEFASWIEARTDGGPAPRVNLWQLAQVPPPGDILIPTWQTAKPYDFFATGVARWCRVEPGSVVFPVTGAEQHKLGLDSSVVCGRLGYLRRLSDDRWSLFVRGLQPVPGGFYPDFPIADPDLRCFAVQCYNDDGHYGGFGEAEHHAPTVTTGNTCRSADASQLWTFAGTPQAVRRVAGSLLGPASQCW